MCIYIYTHTYTWIFVSPLPSHRPRLGTYRNIMFRILSVGCEGRHRVPRRSTGLSGMRLWASTTRHQGKITLVFQQVFDFDWAYHFPGDTLAVDYP